ncbi:helix-turn-helix transcriptional regulator [Helcobacillus sp. ACRRO]|uniref:helix-turn-helix domain-containing protein n=1 Tax=Helcobacillus TaxID=1161125 RepID=UPI001EF3E79A|nr:MULTISPECIES: helix-turn-helix transcriptional regulator [Helcobacillus]MCG7427737.1 helix-turn-helix transcriptional regulator [Helcobacillus sp. ACRRO]MDK7742907.1 helix-turn-helix transcriptional regulator [Helcobacillus massiliensis]WOO93556.1 helix-turn-helix transcriptional regulator [Helcobacillus massiliensis]
MSTTIEASTKTYSYRDEIDAIKADFTPAQQREYEAADLEMRVEDMSSRLVYNARRDAGMTQAELAKRAGTNQAVISKIESGQVPTLPMLQRIADALGKDLSVSFN